MTQRLTCRNFTNCQIVAERLASIGSLCGDNNLADTLRETPTYDWHYVSWVSFARPQTIKSIRLDGVGLAPGATGDAWLDDIRIAEVNPPNTQQEYAVFGRDFAGATVLVNPGRGAAPPIALPYPFLTLDGVSTAGPVTLAARSSAILLGDRVGDWNLNGPATTTVPDSSPASDNGTLFLAAQNTSSNRRERSRQGETA